MIRKIGNDKFNFSIENVNDRSMGNESPQICNIKHIEKCKNIYVGNLISLALLQGVMC